MLNDFFTGKCPTCALSIRCETWAEWRCKVLERRFHHNGPLECDDFKKRGKDFKAPKCRCEDCLKNDLLDDMEMEE